MSGRLIGAIIVVTALAAGAAVYYLQVYAFYEEMAPSGPGDVQLTARATGTPEPLAHSDFRAIDATSSPIRYRACFHAAEDPAGMAGRYMPYQDAVPLTAPGWFGCFDAREIGDAIGAGRARAFLGTANIRYGIDRIVAIHDDGRGWAWNQINRCGKIVFEGKPAPDDCPPAPEGY